MKSTVSKIRDLLTPARRRAAIILFILIIFGTLFEVLGLGLLLPVIVLLVEDDLASSYPVVQPLLEALGNPDHEMQVKIVMSLLVSVYLLKNLYLAFLAWWQARFTVGLQVELSQRLFSLYLRQPYKFHLQRNSANLIRNVTGEVGQFIGFAVNPVLTLFAELLVMITVISLLLAVEPVGSLIVFVVLSGAAGLFYVSMRKRITRWGQIRQYHDGQRIQHLQQGLGGVKDVKLLGRESDFINVFREHSSKSGQMSQFMEILQKLPRLWLEVLAVIGFALLVLTMLAQGQAMSAVVPTIGLFAAAAFRLMPSVTRILHSVQALRYGLPVVENLYKDFQLTESEVKAVTAVSGKSVELKNEIELVGVTFNYPDTKASAVIDASLKIRQGDSVGFVGPSGSGKSTLVDLLLGLLKPASGAVMIDGENIENNMRGWQDQIGYVPQTIYLTDDTLRRNIAFGLPEAEIDIEAVKRAISAAQLDEFVSSLAEGLETIVGERGVRLSGGQRQRIGIARALYHDPGVLVLDEATSALDTETEAGVMRSVMALHGSKTVIIVAHRLSTVENCDYLYRLEKGRIVAHGMPGKILSLNIK